MTTTGRATPGRGLPTTITDFTCRQLDPRAAALVLALVRLVVDEVGTFRRLAEAAHRSTADLPRPAWATGEPGDGTRARLCSQHLSKALGRGARRAPDWRTVAWVLHLCVPDDDRRAATTDRITALWHEAHDRPVVAGDDDTGGDNGDNDNAHGDNTHVVTAHGDNTRGDNARGDIARGDNAGGDNARGDDVAALVARIAEQDRLIHDLVEQISWMGEANAEQRQRLLRAELEARAAHDRFDAKHAKTVENHGRQLRHVVDNGNRRLRGERAHPPVAVVDDVAELPAVVLDGLRVLGVEPVVRGACLQLGPWFR